MSTVLLPLETIRLSSAADRLRLFTQSSVSLRCNHKDYTPPEGAQLFDLLKSGEAWVRRGTGCCLNFNLRTNSQSFTHDERDNIMENLGSYLRNEEFWSQLSLEVTLDIPDTRTEHKHDFSLKLNHTRQPVALYGTIPSHIPAPGDIKPPMGIYVFEMESVTLMLNFKEYPVVSSTDSRSQTEIEDLMLLDCNHDAPFKDFYLPEESHDYSMKTRPWKDFESLFECDAEYLDEEILLHNTNHTTTLPTPPASAHASQSSQKGGMASPIELSKTITQPAAILDLSAIRKTTSFALRTLIGGRQMKRESGMKLWKNQSFHALSDIAPAIWSPGFLEAMSQRFRFISPISSAFSNSILKNAQSPSLRQKLLELKFTSTIGRVFRTTTIEESVESDEQLITPDCEGTMQNIQAKLWRMMYLSLYDPRAARRLTHGTPDEVKTDIDDEGDQTMIDIFQIRGVASEGHRQTQSPELFDFTAEGFDDLYDEVVEEDQDSFDFLLDNRKDGTLFDNLLEERDDIDRIVNSALEGTSEVSRDLCMVDVYGLESGTTYGDDPNGVLALSLPTHNITTSIDNEGMLI